MRFGSVALPLGLLPPPGVADPAEASAPAAKGIQQHGPNLWVGLGCLPAQVRVTPAALDPVQQRRLWEVSETLTAVGQ